MWRVYDYNRPLDHPQGYTARLLEIHEDGVVSSTGTSITGTLADIRDTFQQAGLHCTPWHDGDELRVVESWALPDDAVQTSVYRAMDTQQRFDEIDKIIAATGERLRVLAGQNTALVEVVDTRLRGISGKHTILANTGEVVDVRLRAIDVRLCAIGRQNAALAEAVQVLGQFIATNTDAIVQHLRNAHGLGPGL
jgi:hypothetical protein